MPHSHGDICIYCLNVNTPISSWISTKEIPSSLFLDDGMTWALGYWLNSHCNRSPCQIRLFRLILQRALLVAAVCKLRIAKIPPKFFLRTDLEKHHHIPGIQIKKTKKSMNYLFTYAFVFLKKYWSKCQLRTHSFLCFLRVWVSMYNFCPQTEKRVTPALLGHQYLRFEPLEEVMEMFLVICTVLYSYWQKHSVCSSTSQKGQNFQSLLWTCLLGESRKSGFVAVMQKKEEPFSSRLVRDKS